MHHALAKTRWVSDIMAYWPASLPPRCWRHVTNCAAASARQMRPGTSGSPICNRLQLSAVLSYRVFRGLGSATTVDRCFIRETTKLDEAARCSSVNIDRTPRNCQLPCLRLYCVTTVQRLQLNPADDATYSHNLGADRALQDWPAALWEGLCKNDGRCIFLRPDEFTENLLIFFSGSTPHNDCIYLRIVWISSGHHMILFIYSELNHLIPEV